MTVAPVVVIPLIDSKKASEKFKFADEKINGKGYPNGYKGEELPLQARVIALADVFEGLTAPDRPYKEGYKLSKAMNILKDMTRCEEIDKEIFNLFIKQNLKCF